MADDFGLSEIVEQGINEIRNQEVKSEIEQDYQSMIGSADAVIRAIVGVRNAVQFAYQVLGIDTAGLAWGSKKQLSTIGDSQNVRRNGGDQGEEAYYQLEYSIYVFQDAFLRYYHTIEQKAMPIGITYVHHDSEGEVTLYEEELDPNQRPILARSKDDFKRIVDKYGKFRTGQLQGDGFKKKEITAKKQEEILAAYKETRQRAQNHPVKPGYLVMWKDFGRWVLAIVSALGYLAEAYAGFIYANEGGNNLAGLFESGSDIETWVGDFMTGTVGDTRSSLFKSKQNLSSISKDTIKQANKFFQNEENTQGLGVLSTTNLSGFLYGDVGNRQIKSEKSGVMGISNILKFAKELDQQLNVLQNDLGTSIKNLQKFIKKNFKDGHATSKIVGVKSGRVGSETLYKTVFNVLESNSKAIILPVNL